MNPEPIYLKFTVECFQLKDGRGERGLVRCERGNGDREGKGEGRGETEKRDGGELEGFEG